MPEAYQTLKSCPECYSEYDDSVKTCPVDESLLRTIEKDPFVGSLLANRYHIESVLGRGGMGVVYKARQQQMDKYMAIKMLHSHLVAEPEAVKRFHREAKTVSLVRHHHIITLYDFGMSSQRQPYLVMDYLEGTSLKNLIKEVGPMPLDRAERIYAQVVDALDTAHSQDLVHRDLKPENIMLSKYNNEEDWVTLVDFGLSKLKETKPPEDSYQITKVGDVCGSPPYMSPEQCLSSQVVDPRSDIYSLGICVYETLSGKLPFNAKSAIEMLDCHLYATPIPFSQSLPEFKVCSEITTVLNKSMQKEPEKRHQTVAEFGAEFAEAIRRDSIKLKAYRHRLQTSEFADLASEAEALSREMYDTGRLQPVAAEATVLEGVQFVQDAPPSNLRSRTGDHKAPTERKTTDRKKLDTETSILDKMQKQLTQMMETKEKKHTWTHCPYCDAPSEPDVKFCLNCKHQFIKPEEAARLKAAQEADYDTGTKGFSKRAKAATAGSGRVPLQVIVGVLLLIIAGVVGYLAYTEGGFENLARKLSGAAPQSEPIETVGSEAPGAGAPTTATSTGSQANAVKQNGSRGNKRARGTGTTHGASH